MIWVNVITISKSQNYLIIRDLGSLSNNPDEYLI